jgi:vacuolar-type H+-ATPase subunit C/Vma6
MFIELDLSDGRKTIIKVEDIERVVENIKRSDYKAKVITKNGYYYTRTSYETIKERINQCMQ